MLPWGFPLQSAPWPRPFKENYKFVLSSKSLGVRPLLSVKLLVQRPGSQSRTGAPLRGCAGGRTS